MGAVGGVHEKALAARGAGADGLIGFSGGDRHTTTRLLDPEFPPFRKLIPSDQLATADLQTQDLIEAVRRVALVADRGAQVRMEFDGDVLHLSAGAEDVGRAEEDLPVEFSGEPLTIAFNPTYLTDGLGSLHSEKVTFGFTTPSRPAVLRPAGDDGVQSGDAGPFPAGQTDYVYLLMPVRLPG